MKKLIGTIAIAVCLVASGFAESFRCTAKLKGIQNEIVEYVENDLVKDFDSFWDYAKYITTTNNVCLSFSDDEEDLYNEKVDNSPEYSYARYFDKAWEKFSYANGAFGLDYSKNDKKKLNKIGSGSKSLVYIRTIFNSCEITIDDKPNANCMQWEFIHYTDENGKSLILHVWQGSKNNDPKDFVTYID